MAGNSFVTYINLQHIEDCAGLKQRKQTNILFGVLLFKYMDDLVDYRSDETCAYENGF